MSQEEINRIYEILSCDNCPTSYACEACDITWTDKNLIKKYISELEQENNKQNKIIDEMVETLVGLTVWDSEKDEPFILGDKEEVKKYFEKKVEKKI